MKLMNAFYTNPELTDLLTYGIEGEDYVVGDDGLYTYPDGADASAVYHPNVAVFMFNEFIAGVWEGNDPDIWEKVVESMKSVPKSCALGFAYDSSALSTEIAAISNVRSQYLDALNTGAADPETELPKFLEELDNAGMQTVIDAKQEQLDAWMSSK